MRPFSALYNLPNSSAAYAKPRPDTVLSMALFNKLPYFKNIVVSEFGLRVIFPSESGLYNAVSVLDVLAPRYILKIVKAVIGLVAVLVINLFSWWAGANKDVHNKTVDKPVNIPAVISKPYNAVIWFYDAWLNFFSWVGVWGISATDNPSLIAYFVETDKFGNIFPLFNHGNLQYKTPPRKTQSCRAVSFAGVQVTSIAYSIL